MDEFRGGVLTSGVNHKVARNRLSLKHGKEALVFNRYDVNRLTVEVLRLNSPRNFIILTIRQVGNRFSHPV